MAKGNGSHAGAALITGASAGLGREFARLFAADGCPVVLVARREDKLREIAESLQAQHGARAHCLTEDLADSEAPERIVRAVAERGERVDYLVNNAGFGTCGPFSQLDPDRELSQIAVNITALTHLTRLLLPTMLERGLGRILNIGSTAGFVAGPYMATYYASKAYVNSFSEALAHEVEGSGVTVTVSCPGPVETEFPETSGNGETRLFQGKTATPDAIAGEAYRAMARGRRMVIHGAKYRFNLQGMRFIPRRSAQRVAAKLNRPPGQG